MAVLLSRRENCEALTDIFCANDWSVLSGDDLLPACDSLPSARNVSACFPVDLFDVTPDKITGFCLICRRLRRRHHRQCNLVTRNGLITIAIRARFEYDSTTIRLQHATTRYEVFRSLAYEIVYENQW